VEDERSGRPRSHRTDGNVKKVRNLVRRKMSKLWPNDWILHDDNALSSQDNTEKRGQATKSLAGFESPLPDCMYFTLCYYYDWDLSFTVSFKNCITNVKILLRF
jgi:hypothetical protein